MRQGFTLLELLIVMAILALLTVYIVPLLMPITEDAKLSQDVRAITQTFYEVQTKSQNGFRTSENMTPINEKIVYAATSSDTPLPFHSFGLLLSTDKKTGVRMLDASIVKNNDTYSISNETEGKNILSPKDQENSPSSFLSDISKDTSSLSEIKLYFIPFSNTILHIIDGRVHTDGSKIRFTTANSRYPRLTRTTLLDTGTLMLTSPPSL